MTTAGPLIVVVVVAALFLGLWCVWTATRLDRMHLLLDSSSAALSESLLRRSAVATDVALSESFDPASSLALLDAAAAAREGSRDDWQTQSALSSVLRMVTDTDLGMEASYPLDRACREVALARRIHNDLVVRAQGLHSRRRVRWFRLAGHAPWPETIEFDALDEIE